MAYIFQQFVKKFRQNKVESIVLKVFLSKESHAGTVGTML